MCSYVGGKYLIGKEIAKIINKEIEETGYIYIEPFCGMLGVGRHIKSEKRIFSDKNKDLIDFWNAIKSGWKPKVEKPTKEEWEELKKQESNPQRTFSGYKWSYAGNFFNTLKPDVIKSKPFKFSNLDNAVFECKDYKEYKDIKNHIFYLDPPYKGVKSQKEWGKFDSEEFWIMVKELSKNNVVFISEQDGTKDYPIAWKKKMRRSLGKRKEVTEYLYRLCD